MRSGGRRGGAGQSSGAKGRSKGGVLGLEGAEGVIDQRPDHLVVLHGRRRTRPRQKESDEGGGN